MANDAPAYERPAPTELPGELWFEDFTLGRRIVTASRTIDEPEILAFGRVYANQPYHTDPEAAKASIYGGLIAPGYMTAAITFGLFADTGALAAGGMGSPGVDKLRWHKPVRAGDMLHVEAEVVEVSPAPEPGGRDGVRITYTTVNQKGEPVMTLTSLHFVRRRPQ
jgi:acyl dehydratase